MAGCLLCLAVRPPETQSLCHEGYQVCPDHQRQVREVLVDINTMYLELQSADHLATTRDRDAERWVGGRAPLDCRVVAVLDRRSRQLSKSDEVSPLRVVRCWAYATFHYQPHAESWADATVWSHSNPLPDLGITVLIAYLLARLPDICQTEAVLQFARHMAAIRHQLHILLPSF